MKKVKKQKIIIADNNRFFREGLKFVLLNIGNVSIVGEAESGIQLLEVMQEADPDIVFMDIAMPGLSGVDTVQAGHIMHPETTFIAFTSFENQRYIKRMVAAGVSGYLIKSSDNSEVLQEIVADRRKRFFLSPGMVNQNLIPDILNQRY
jgi:DNA-binding NarL/FixJ family response regulator